MYTRFMKWLGRKFIPWDPWSVREIHNQAHEVGYKQGFRQGIKAEKKSHKSNCCCKAAND